MKDFLINKACIIDDDKLYTSLVTRIIRKNKLAKEILLFENGQHAFEYFTKHLNNHEVELPSIVLLDINMPIMDGWEFLAKMKVYHQQLTQHNVTINVVSSTINPIEVDRANNHEIVHQFLTKPISKEAMVHVFSKKM